MNKTAKIILGVTSAWPVVYLGVFTQIIFPTLMGDGFKGDYLATIVGLHFLTFLLCAFLFFYYLIKIINDKTLGNERTLWILGTIFLNAIVWPAYWYLHIWKKIK